MKRTGFEQHVAVFGESGSGKTTLISVFYGHQQAAKFSRVSGYSLLANDASQGNRLLKSYHLMEDNLLPPSTRYSQTVFSFGIRPRGLRKDAGLLLWHDYPGEWWTETREGEEGERKKEAFKALLCSDVALLLVDGQRLLANKEHYLPRLFKSFRDELSRQRDALIGKDSLLECFPRVWIICLSKADLFPGKDAEWFRTQVIKQASDELEALRDEIKSMVNMPDFVALGDEYLLLSSAKFDAETGQIQNPKKTIGIDLISPLAITSPLRHAKKWAKIECGGKKALMILAEAFRGVSTGWMRILPIVGSFFTLLDEELKGGTEKLRQIHEKAVEKGNAVDAVLSAFELRLTQNEAEKVYFGHK
jgi:hypothetical protein